jgi:hypothetical protein
MIFRALRMLPILAAALSLGAPGAVAAADA